MVPQEALVLAMQRVVCGAVCSAVCSVLCGCCCVQHCTCWRDVIAPCGLGLLQAWAGVLYASGRTTWRAPSSAAALVLCCFLHVPCHSTLQPALLSPADCLAVRAALQIPLVIRETVRKYQLILAHKFVLQKAQQ